MSNMSLSTKKQILKQLKSSLVGFCHSDIPEEYQNDKDIIIAEREARKRIVEKIGYDVIQSNFFVNESVLFHGIGGEDRWRSDNRRFASFDEYYSYLNGEIYDNACYYQLDLSGISYDFDMERFPKRSSFIEDTIDDYICIPTAEDEAAYDEGEKVHKLVKKWIEKFNSSKTFDQFSKTLRLYEKSTLYLKYNVGEPIFLWNYLFADTLDLQKIELILQLASEGLAFGGMLNSLCHVYDPQVILEHYNPTYASKKTNAKYRRELQNYIKNLKEAKIESKKTLYFDTKTHYYYVKDSNDVCVYYESFALATEGCNYDLSGADLRKDIKLEFDFSRCKVDQDTLLPVHCYKKLRYVVRKKYFSGRFHVLQAWYNEAGRLIKHFSHSFEFFFDFVAFLKGDLTGSDLVMCDGLKNLLDVSEINLRGAGIRSEICDQLKIPYDSYSIDTSLIQSFHLTENNEKETALALHADERTILPAEGERKVYWGWNPESVRISYISDIHLMHKLEHAKVKSKADIAYVLRSIARTIASETAGILLIGGDTAADFVVFQAFVTYLKQELDRLHRHPYIVFILGNHELWPFPEEGLDSSVEKYREVLERNGMHLLQNNLIYEEVDRKWNTIPEGELDNLSRETLNARLRPARLILFGGLAFSGVNPEFNADMGLYRQAINREQEIKESKKFKSLYESVVEALPVRNTIIFTHMPLDCWNETVEYKKGLIYVSGHTHRNAFYDDLETRIYADNQIGYGNNSPHLKQIILDGIVDCFDNYSDGIHKIKREDYVLFFRGKNIMINFNRQFHALYMLKKHGYYLFICELESGNLSILNGGNLKRLPINDLQYYYDRMDQMIDKIKKPLDKYSEVQKKIASEIQKIGGEGYIHGCIIDIDYYNHIYLNPVDFKITGYWALDVVFKRIYPNVPTLLKQECPKLYSNYLKMIGSSKKDMALTKQNANTELAVLPQIYLDTDIYKASREIKKMQRLNDNILTTWYETVEASSAKRKERGSSRTTTDGKTKESFGKAVLQLDDTGKIIHEYSSIKEASREVGISSKCIRDAIKGVQKHAAGYVWRLKDKG